MTLETNIKLKHNSEKCAYPCVVGKVKSVDYPTVDNILSNEELKSSGRMKQKKLVAKGCHATEEVIYRMYVVLVLHGITTYC